MTDRARFGDLLRLAAERLDATDGTAARRTTSGTEVQATVHALLDLVTVMSRLIAISDASAPDAVGWRARQPGTWNHARAEVRRALDNAVGFLRPHAAALAVPGASASLAAGAGVSIAPEHGAVGRLTAAQPGPVDGASPEPGTGPDPPPGHGAAGRLAAATLCLRTGHDLLQTHYHRRPDGTREYRSTWAAAIGSDQVNTAMLTEIARIAHRAAAQASGIALAPSRGAKMATRHDLNLACQWLWVLVAAVRSAHRDEPVPAATRDLLYHIPANTLPDRRVPIGGEPVTELCDGAISTAERVRHLAWDFTKRAAWSPAMNITTLTRTVGAATVTSHNCELLLTTLASSQHAAKLRRQLRDAAAAAGRSRLAWLAVIDGLADITTDTRGHQSPAAIEIADLALWTGRLAFATLDWTPASGPRHPVRPPARLIASPEDLRRVVAAVHYACDTLTSLARTSRTQIRVATQASRILVPTRTLPERIDVPYAFSHAPGPHVASLLDHYHDAAVACRQATAGVAVIADTVRAPSQVLTAAREAIRAERAHVPSREPQADAGHHLPEHDHWIPGPLENVLYQLGVTDPQLLQRATTLDRDGTRLIIHAAERLGPARQRSTAAGPSTSLDTAAALINHALVCSESGLHGAYVPASANRDMQREAGS